MQNGHTGSVSKGTGAAEERFLRTRLWRIGDRQWLDGDDPAAGTRDARRVCAGGETQMSVETQYPTRLASEDVIINAPLSYAGSAQRIMRLRRRASAGWQLVAVTLLAILLTLLAWAFVTCWYLTWGLWLVPYRVLRRGARKRKAEAIRHRELLGTIQGSAAASASAIVGSTVGAAPSTAQAPASRDELVADADRHAAIEDLRPHLLVGRLTSEEFEDRVAAAHHARTRADLDAVTANLPPALPEVG
jgi:uncharacterized protein DUF1707